MSTNQHKSDSTTFLLRRANGLVLLLSCLMVIAGFILMTGKSTTEVAFCQDVFSWRRIVLAPFLCLAGYLLMVVGIIMRQRRD